MQIKLGLKIPCYIRAVILSFLLSCCGKSIEQAAESAIGKVKLKDLNDQSINLSHYEDKVIFINFWATWCRPCLEEMPSIERARTILKDQKIEFILASNEDLSRIQNFIAKRGFKLNFVKLENLEELNIQALPTTFIFDKEGKLVFSETGYRQWDDPQNIEMITKIINNHE